MLINTNSSETSTADIKVRAVPHYEPEHSTPELSKYLFSYHISISNEGQVPVKLISREWLIINSEGDETNVRGPGVIGEQPLLAPGETFEYSSFCILDTLFGTMEGYYYMEREGGDMEKVKIERFYLATNAED